MQCLFFRREKLKTLLGALVVERREFCFLHAHYAEKYIERGLCLKYLHSQSVWLKCVKKNGSKTLHAEGKNQWCRWPSIVRREPKYLREGQGGEGRRPAGEIMGKGEFPSQLVDVGGDRSKYLFKV